MVLWEPIRHLEMVFGAIFFHSTLSFHSSGSDRPSIDRIHRSVTEGSSRPIAVPFFLEGGGGMPEPISDRGSERNRKPAIGALLFALRTKPLRRYRRRVHSKPFV